MSKKHLLGSFSDKIYKFEHTIAQMLCDEMGPCQKNFTNSDRNKMANSEREIIKFKESHKWLYLIKLGAEKIVYTKSRHMLC